MLSEVSRNELDRRGVAIQQRVLSNFSWPRQGARLAKFLSQVCNGNWVTEELSEALAA